MLLEASLVALINSGNVFDGHIDDGQASSRPPDVFILRVEIGGHAFIGDLPGILIMLLDAFFVTRSTYEVARHLLTSMRLVASFVLLATLPMAG